MKPQPRFLETIRSLKQILDEEPLSSSQCPSLGCDVTYMSGSNQIRKKMCIIMRSLSLSYKTVAKQLLRPRAYYLKGRWEAVWSVLLKVPPIWEAGKRSVASCVQKWWASTERLLQWWDMATMLPLCLQLTEEEKHILHQEQQEKYCVYQSSHWARTLHLPMPLTGPILHMSRIQKRW